MCTKLRAQISAPKIYHEKRLIMRMRIIKKKLKIKSKRKKNKLKNWTSMIPYNVSLTNNSKEEEDRVNWLLLSSNHLLGFNLVPVSLTWLMIKTILFNCRSFYFFTVSIASKNSNQQEGVWKHSLWRRSAPRGRRRGSLLRQLQIYWNLRVYVHLNLLLCTVLIRRRSQMLMEDS